MVLPSIVINLITLVINGFNLNNYLKTKHLYTPIKNNNYGNYSKTRTKNEC